MADQVDGGFLRDAPTAGKLGALVVKGPSGSGGAIPTSPASTDTATTTSVATSTTSATLLASNAARKGATIYNDSLVVLYVKLGTTASAASFAVAMAAGSYYEVPSWYTGRIDGVLASSTGNARITEG